MLIVVLSATPQKISLPGRGQECKMLAALVSGIAEGAGGALVFHGDMGIGKSALVRFAAGEAAAFVVVAVTGCEAEAGMPFAALHHLLHLLVEQLPEQLSRQAVRLTEALEEGTGGGLALPAQVLRLFRLAARERPLLCAVDDAHWLDEPSLDVLAFVARRVRGERIGVLFAHCDEGRESKALAGVPAHRLAPLDQRASREILRTTVAMPEVSVVLAESAKGNPRALTDLAVSLTPGQLRGDQPAPRTLPPDSGLRRAYRSRLDRLSAHARWLVLLVAADDQGNVDTLVRAAATSGVDIAALEPAESAGVVHVEGTTVSFPQPLLRAVAYQEATLAQRRAAHRCLAQAVDPGTHPLRHALHRAAAADGPDDLLAAELERTAADPVRSYDTSSRALERAADLTSDPVTAGARLVAAARYAWRAGEPNRARNLLRLVPTTAGSVDIQAESKVLAGEIELRVGAASAARRTLLAVAVDSTTRDRFLALGAFMRAGEALCLSGGYPHYPDIARRALALRRPNEPPGVESMFDHFATLSATFRGEHSQATGPSRRLFALARTATDVETLIRTSMVAIFRGDEAQAYRLATKAAQVARADGDVSTVPQAMEVATLAEFLLGRYDNTTAGLEGHRLAGESGQGNLAGNYLAILAASAAMTGDRHTCLLRLKEAAAHQVSHGVNRATAIGDWALSALDLADGRYADVVTHLRKIITDGSGSGHLIVQVGATPLLVEAALRCGQRAIAVDALRVYDSWAGSTGSPHWLALSARCHALLVENADEAEAYFREALGQHVLGTTEFDLARTGLLFGQHLRRRRKPKAAREFLHSALSTFERFDARPWAERAAAELRAAGHPVRPGAGGVTKTLTPHQAQIAGFVAEGATNREVAIRMLISTRTVDHHMRNIFVKLGVRSRVELAKLMR
jgi:DNA-binding CsgD family transcriptional regulator